LGIDLGRYRDQIDVLVPSLSVAKIAEHGSLLQILGDLLKAAALRYRSHLNTNLPALPGT
jgi:hypothetical protein